MNDSESDPSTVGYDSRNALLLELEKQIGESANRSHRVVMLRKKLMWNIAIGCAKAIKRGMDIILSALALIALFPLFALIALLIKLEDPQGPVFFVQKRVGRWGKEFNFPKFRSMVADAEKIKDQILHANQHGNSITFKMKDDPRVTRVGKFIRRSSIDELPQLWCVLKGEMSLVGPRPAVPREVAKYNFAQRRRLDCIPGLTCIWQVSGRGDIPFDEQAKLDKEYVESRSVWLDIMLIAKTIPAVFTGKGAY